MIHLNYVLIICFDLFSCAEYSDDDDDHDYALSQPKVNGIRPKTNYSRPLYYDDDEDDEELTIIRRINRYIIRNIRNYSNPRKAESETEFSSLSTNLPKSKFRLL